MTKTDPSQRGNTRHRPTSTPRKKPKIVKKYAIKKVLTKDATLIDALSREIEALTTVIENRIQRGITSEVSATVLYEETRKSLLIKSHSWKSSTESAITKMEKKWNNIILCHNVRVKVLQEDLTLGVEGKIESRKRKDYKFSIPPNTVALTPDEKRDLVQIKLDSDVVEWKKSWTSVWGGT